MGGSTTEDLQTGRSFEGSEAATLSSIARDGRGREDPEASQPHFRSGPDQGIWTPGQVDNLELQLLEAFKAGDPQGVWGAADAILQALRSCTDQAARERYKATFGTARCHTCTGMQAGPDVIATCWQTRLCLYCNVTTPQNGTRVGRVLRSFSE